MTTVIYSPLVWSFGGKNRLRRCLGLCLRHWNNILKMNQSAWWCQPCMAHFWTDLPVPQLYCHAIHGNVDQNPCVKETPIFCSLFRAVQISLHPRDCSIEPFPWSRAEINGLGIKIDFPTPQDFVWVIQGQNSYKVKS